MNPEVILPVLFLFVAMLYSSVGLGGGSSYTALMAIFGINHELIPTTSLTLNLVVALIGVLTFWRRGYLNYRLILPFLVTSVPMAYVGGALHISERLFFWLLLLTLILVALRVYLWDDLKLRIQLTDRQRLTFSLCLGAILGFVAGTVGIGGGIYLVPLLILFGLASEKQAAAAGASFILLNSVAGLVSRAQRGAFSGEVILPMVGAVVIGGIVGAHVGSQRFKPRTVQRTLGIVILLAIFYLFRKLV